MDGVSQFALFLLFIAVLLTFGRTYFNDFAGFDNDLTLIDNPRMNPEPPKTAFEECLWYWAHPAWDLYFPVTCQIWGLLASLPGSHRGGPSGPLDAAPFHAASIVVHFGSSLVVFRLLRRLTRQTWPALAGAALFSLHPLQVESVAWASGLKDLLAGFFSLAALSEYMLYVRRRPEEGLVDGQPARSWWPMGRAILLMTLAILSKPSAMVLPAVAIVVDRFVIHRPWRDVFRSSWPLIVFALPWAVVAKFVQSAATVEPTPLAYRPLVVGDTLAFYLSKLVLPVGLAPHYGRIFSIVLQHGWLAWTWAIPAVVGLVIWRAGRGRPWLLGSALTVVVALGPVLGLTKFDYQRLSGVADHYMYLPMLGPAIAIAFALAGSKTSRYRLFFQVVVATLLCACGMAAWVQAGYWSDQRALWKHTVAVAPDSFAAYQTLAIFELDNHDYEDAVRTAARAVAIHPGYVKGFITLAMAQMDAKKMNEAELSTRRAIQLQPGSADAHNMAGIICARTNRPGEAEVEFREAIRLDPEFRAPLTNLARLNNAAPATRSLPLLGLD